MYNKTFYALLKQTEGQIHYTRIEAPNQQDAAIYADHMWGDRVKRVYSSGAFWAYKKNHPAIKELQNGQSIHHSV